MSSSKLPFNSVPDRFIKSQIQSDPPQPNHYERKAWPNLLQPAVKNMYCAEGGCCLGSIGDAEK